MTRRHGSASRFSIDSLNRRNFLKIFGGAAALGGITPLAAQAAAAGARATPAEYPFAAVPPSSSGMTFTHTAGHSAEKYLPESTGSGCAFLDYDNDGWMDIYFVNGGAADFYKPPRPLRNALYRNNHDGTFTDVTEKAGVGAGGYGMGVAVGDYNADGFPDMYVTQYGRSILYRNNGDGTFADVTEKAGVSAPGWASSAVWFDYDNDGLLDLFVCQFVEFSKSIHHRCGDPNNPALKGEAEYCYPKIYKPMPCWLYRNNGDGTFTDVSQQVGIAANPGKSWGVVATDVNNDGFLDLFVANDTVANFLFMNRGGKRFEEIGFTAGVAFGEQGKARSGMGVDAADYDQDGWSDLFVTNMDHEFYALYRNRHDESFDDKTSAAGIARSTQLMSGWGVKFFDYDNDGDLDLFIANGHPDDLINKIYPAVFYREPLLLFENTGGGFKNISAAAGPVFQQPMAGRGLALGDFDNDGAVDVLISNNDEPPLLLHNDAARAHHWLGLRLVGKKANIDAVGAKIIYQAGDLKRTREKIAGGSYLSSQDPRIVLGIGARTKIDWLEIHWPAPSTLIERIASPPLDRYITITEGHGIAGAK